MFGTKVYRRYHTAFYIYDSFFIDFQKIPTIFILKSLAQ